MTAIFQVTFDNGQGQKTDFIEMLSERNSISEFQYWVETKRKELAQVFQGQPGQPGNNFTIHCLNRIV